MVQRKAGPAHISQTSVPILATNDGMCVITKDMHSPITTTLTEKLVKPFEAAVRKQDVQEKHLMWVNVLERMK